MRQIQQNKLVSLFLLVILYSFRELFLISFLYVFALNFCKMILQVFVECRFVVNVSACGRKLTENNVLCVYSEQSAVSFASDDILHVQLSSSGISPFPGENANKDVLHQYLLCLQILSPPTKIRLAAGKAKISTAFQATVCITITIPTKNRVRVHIHCQRSQLFSKLNGQRRRLADFTIVFSELVKNNSKKFVLLENLWTPNPNCYEIGETEYWPLAQYSLGSGGNSRF